MSSSVGQVLVSFGASFLVPLALGLILWSAGVGEASAYGEPLTESSERSVTDSYIQRSVGTIRRESALKARVMDAQRLAEWIRETDPSRVRDKDMDAIGGLLSDPDDPVRMWAAGALGFLGPRAQRTVPALQEALKERGCSLVGPTSSDAIRLALSRIGAKPVDLLCEDPFVGGVR